MATAYKYVERNNDNNINWAEVGSNVNNMLNEEVRVREEKKAAIDEASREYQRVLNNVPQGENSELNKFAIGFSEKLQKQMLMQETLLKSGQLNPRQYTMMRANITDGTDQGFSLLQDYNDEYSAKMELLGDDVAYGEQLSNIDLEIMANVEGFSNFNNSELVINPETGLVSMGKLIENPDDPSGPKILDPNRNNLVSVQNLKNRIKTKITKYDVVSAAKDWTSTLGTDVVQTVINMGTSLSSGQLRKISDIRNRDGGFNDMTDEQLEATALEMGVKPSDLKALSLWDESRNTWAESQLQGKSFNGASILMDFNKATPDGQVYSTTFDEADTLDANGNRKQNIILLKNENGRTITEMTDEQNAVAARSLAAQAEMQISTIDEVSTQKMKEQSRPATVTEDKNKKLAEEQQSVVGNFAKLWYGNDTEVKEAEDFLRSLNDDIVEIDRDGESVVVVFSNGKTETLSFTDDMGAEIDQASFIKGNVNKVLGADTKIKDVEATLKKSQFDGTRKFNEKSIGYSAAQGGGTQEAINVAFDRVVKEENPIPKNAIKIDNKNGSVAGVQAFVNSLPGLSGKYTVRAGGWGTDDYVEIVDKNDKVVSKSPDFSTKQPPDSWWNSLYDLSKNSTNVEEKGLIVQGKREFYETTRTSKKQKLKAEKDAKAKAAAKVKLNGQ
tara:strand:+ start:1187 stop:3199 length:2013 start_codon:yes stop_codon:yes gene_type:complete